MKTTARRQRNWCSTYEDVVPEKERVESAIVGGICAFASSMTLLAFISLIMK
ncbi:MAG: hypothetical protein AB8G05_00595 [Oligoflexales bacterium]